MSPFSFHTLPSSKPDAIFAVASAAKAAGPSALNGTVGVYVDEEGRAVLIPSVQKAMRDLAQTLTERSYNYPALLGLPEYSDAVVRLIFGESTFPVAAIATTGGTGALALNLRLATLMQPDSTLLLPIPTWANHSSLCRAAGVRTMEVPYLLEGEASTEGLTQALNHLHGGTAVLLQVGCHNPTGKDFSTEQWQELAELFSTTGTIALLDLAYQGFGGEPEKDSWPVRLFAESGVTTLVAWSGAKNHSLYSERTGLACALVPDWKTKAVVESHYSAIIRSLHSAAATFGQSVIARVQSSHYDEWLHDMATVREILHRKREMLREQLPPQMRKSIEGHGMFSVLPLLPEHLETLQRSHAVFLTSDGRINIAGIALKRIPELVEKIRMTMSSS